MTFDEFQKRYQKAPVEHFPTQVTDKPVVSVCVQTYQHREYIEKCLDGILSQKVSFEYEILLGEDHSKDGTREICIEYARKYPGKVRLFLHQRENNLRVNGTPTGRFLALYNLFQAQGKYVAFCDGDDFWINNKKLQQQVDFLEANPEVSLASCYSIKSEGPQNILIRDNRPLYFSFEDVFRKYFSNMHNSTRLIRNHPLLKDLPAWHLNHLSFDTFLFFMLIKHVGPAVTLPFVGAIYTVHDGGIFTVLDKRAKGVKARKLREDLVKNGYFNSKRDEYRFERMFTRSKFWYTHLYHGRIRRGLQDLANDCRLGIKILSS